VEGGGGVTWKNLTAAVGWPNYGGKGRENRERIVFSQKGKKWIEKYKYTFKGIILHRRLGKIASKNTETGVPGS